MSARFCWFDVVVVLLVLLVGSMRLSLAQDPIGGDPPPVAPAAVYIDYATVHILVDVHGNVLEQELLIMGHVHGESDGLEYTLSAYWFADGFGWPPWFTASYPEIEWIGDNSMSPRQFWFSCTYTDAPDMRQKNHEVGVVLQLPTGYLDSDHEFAPGFVVWLDD